MNIFTLPYRERLVKILLIMKLVSFFILLACFSVSASVVAQTITLNEKNAPLSKVFKLIEGQSGYSFFYKNEVLKTAKPVTVTISNATLGDALAKCFEGQPLAYEVIDNTITIKPKVRAFTKRLKDLFSVPKKVSGRVSDTAGTPLPGASIRIQDKDILYTTPSNGEFSIEAELGDVVIISFVGYAPVTFVVSDDLSFQNIILHRLNSTLNEVSVLSTGYQSVPRERATGSFSQPNKQLYESRVSTDVISKLDGITSGLIFNTTGITSSNTPKLSVRGRSTIYANDNPLIVVDNFPYDGDISNINPNDVESVTILKDAAAASIWGVQAGNGVIVITTKKGANNSPLNIRFNSNLTIANKPNLYYDRNFLPSSSYIDVEKYLFDKGYYDGEIALNDPSDPNSTFTPLSPVVVLLNRVKSGLISQSSAESQINAIRNNDVRADLSKYFYQRSLNQQYLLSLDGGLEKYKYYFSAGYDNNRLNQVGSQSDRLTINSQNTFQVFKSLQFNAGINYVHSSQTADNTLSQLSPGGRFLTVFPYTQLKKAAGALPIVKDYNSSFVQNAENRGFLNWQFLPVDELNNGYNTLANQLNDIRLTTGLRYSIINGLNADIKYQYQKTLADTRSLGTAESYYARNLVNQYSSLDANGNVSGRNIPAGGILNQFDSGQDAHHFRGQLDYALSGGRSQLAAIAGYEITEVSFKGSSNLLYGYDENLGISTPVDYVNGFTLTPGNGFNTIPYGNTSVGTLDRYRSYFANAAYTYDEKYTVSASGRIDASNYFGVNTNQKSVPLWSVGAKWDLSKENFYKIAMLPSLQFRGSYGFQGNLDKTLSAYNTISYVATPAQYTNALLATLRNVGNPELRWEKVRQLNVALDFATIGQRLTGTVEMYFKKGIDLIGFSVFAPSTGITQMKGNYSGISGKGIDIQLNSQNIKGKFSWSSSFLFSRATDKVTLYTGTPFTANNLVGTGKNILPVVGRPVYGLYSYKWAGLSATSGDPQGYDNQMALSTDFAALRNPADISQITYHGPSRPVTFGGFGNRFTYDGWALAFNISYKLGYYVRRNSLSYTSLYDQGVGNVEYLNRWQKPGDELLTNVPSQVYPGNSNRDYFYNYSEATVEKGDHVRLQDITLSYDLFRSKYRWLPLKSVQVYGYANNIGILWRANKVKLDPDYPTTGWPAPRTISFGIKGTL